MRPLDSFGDVAAEDDAVLDYFVATDATKAIQAGRVILVLGRKGSGKTALVRHFSEGEHKSITRALSLKGYPWNIHASRIDRGASDIEAYVSSWRYLLSLQFALLAYRCAGEPQEGRGKSLARFLTDNYGGIAPSLGDLLKPPSIRFSAASIEPTVLGCKLGGISFDRGEKDLGLGSELNALSDVLLETAEAIAKASGRTVLHLQIDELDQGLSQMDSHRERMITGLILATRDLQRQMKGKPVAFRPVVYLRTDLWDEISFSDKNKISETSALMLDWNSESLRELINERIRAKLVADASWDTISTDGLMRGSQSKWNHILSRTFMRPRDVIRFLNAALSEARRDAKRRTLDPLLLDNLDVTNARGTYSSYLKSELDDEILAHWPRWEEALQACSALSTITFRRDEFAREYEKRKTMYNSLSSDKALATLYDYSIIGYERRSGYGGQSWVFRYTNPEAGWDNAATVFKVHLGLKEYAKLREERASAEEEA
ncbi:MAG TPA: hypothetical protein VLH56_07535 [Dissulfurispiraceae bacterium]|nr:hypothetical protein [Dissulfurispiraceae bacterium]